MTLILVVLPWLITMAVIVYAVVNAREKEPEPPELELDICDGKHAWSKWSAPSRVVVSFLLAADQIVITQQRTCTLCGIVEERKVVDRGPDRRTD